MSLTASFRITPNSSHHFALHSSSCWLRRQTNHREISGCDQVGHTGLRVKIHRHCGGRSISRHQTVANGQLHAAFCSPRQRGLQYPPGCPNGVQSRYEYNGQGNNQGSVVTSLTRYTRPSCELNIRNSPENS